MRPLPLAREEGGPHPHFDDRGSFKWFQSLAAASAAAKAAGKLIFVEYGRQACGNCRDLVENVMTRAEVKKVLDEKFVMCAIDCDQPDPAVRAIGAAHMSYARALPFLMYLDAEGKFLAGSQGGKSAKDLLAELAAAKG